MIKLKEARLKYAAVAKAPFDLGRLATADNVTHRLTELYVVTSVGKYLYTPST